MKAWALGLVDQPDFPAQWKQGALRVDFPVLQPPSGVDAVMSPEEAVAAARILGARTVTPIHYGALHRPPVYVETTEAVGRLRAAGASRGVEITLREPGEWFQLD